jgi:hypothetical protein
MIRVVVAALAFVAGLVLSLLGALWAFFKVIGTEWDYCPSGGHCISGYYPAAGLVLTGGLIASLGLRLHRSGGSH